LIRLSGFSFCPLRPAFSYRRRALVALARTTVSGDQCPLCLKANLSVAHSCGTRSGNIYQFKHMIWINILMTQLKKKIAQNDANVRKHVCSDQAKLSLAGPHVPNTTI
jgi:hypothetical protein